MTSYEAYMKKRALIIGILLVFAVGAVFCSSTYYERGDQVFSIRAGVDFPSFLFFFNDSSRNQTFSDIHMQSVGGVASISYQGFLNEYFAIGGELGYQFINSLTPSLYTTVPITAKLTYYPVQTGLFDLAISLNAGFAFIKYDTGKYFAPFASLTVAPTFYISDTWGIGLESGIMASTEIYLKNSSYDKYQHNSVLGMIPLTVVVSYRH